jgi:hypothetical protein
MRNTTEHGQFIAASIAICVSHVKTSAHLTYKLVISYLDKQCGTKAPHIILTNYIRFLI